MYVYNIYAGEWKAYREDIEPSLQIRELCGAVHKTRLCVRHPSTGVIYNAGHRCRFITRLFILLLYAYVCESRAISPSLSLSSVCLPSTSPATTDTRLLHLLLLSFSPSCYASTGTYRTTFLLPVCSQWPATATLSLLRASSFSSTRPLLSRSNRILDAFSSLLRAALLAST